MKYLFPVLYILGLYGAYLAGSFTLRTKSTEATKPKTFRFPRMTLLLLLLVGIPSTLQIFFPDLLTWLQRDAARILDGEWWRLITSLVVQDGGISGAAFNLVSLLLIGWLAEQFWERKSILVFFFLGGLVGELVGLAWQQASP